MAALSRSALPQAHGSTSAGRPTRLSRKPGPRPACGRPIRRRRRRVQRRLLLVRVDFLELGVDDLVVAGRARRRPAPAPAPRLGLRARPAGPCTSPRRASSRPGAGVSLARVDRLDVLAFHRRARRGRARPRPRPSRPAATLSPFSFRCFSVEWTSASSWLRASTTSRRFLSASAFGLGLLAPCARCRRPTGRTWPGCGSAAPCRWPCPWR